jgi:hypothetical protein
VAMDPETHEPLPEDSPIMVTIRRIWATTIREQREAFHRFTCLNSRAPADLEVMRWFADEIHKAGEAASN